MKRKRTSQKAGTKNSPFKILIIDDDYDMAKVMSLFLEKYDYETIAMNDSIKAVAYYKKSWKSVDLVVVDMSMPKMDGINCFKALKKLNPNIKCLFSSGYSSSYIKTLSEEKGIEGFLEKPLNLVLFLEKINNILR